MPDRTELRPAPGVVIPVADLTIRTSRSSGPGGQHANVTASRVEVVLDLATAPSLSETRRAQLLGRLGPTVRAVAQDARSQARNRELALDRLEERLADALRPRKARHPTRPTRASKERRLTAKKRLGERKQARRKPEH